MTCRSKRFTTVRRTKIWSSIALNRISFSQTSISSLVASTFSSVFTCACTPRKPWLSSWMWFHSVQDHRDSQYRVCRAYSDNSDVRARPLGRWHSWHDRYSWLDSARIRECFLLPPGTLLRAVCAVEAWLGPLADMEPPFSCRTHHGQGNLFWHTCSMFRVLMRSCRLKQS